MAKKKYSLDFFQKYSVRHDGICLSKEYINVRTPLKFRCANGHEWAAQPLVIARGHWCPKCGRMKTSIQDAKDFAKKRNGKFVSAKYTRAMDLHDWECEKGHRWKANFNNIKQGKWCPKCARERITASRRSSIKDLQKVVSRFHGRIISTEYINQQSQITFACRYGHQWDTRAANVFKGHWCPQCRGGVQGNLLFQQLKEEAEKTNGIVCLSKRYINSSSQIRWKCKSGHTFLTSLNRFRKAKLTCPYCDGIFVTRSGLINFAKEKGGRCENPKNAKASSIFSWECNLGHKWRARFSSIRKGKWCPKCRLEEVWSGWRLELSKLEAIAKARGGKLLTQNYKNQKSRLLLECGNGHRWETAAGSFVSGSWCPECSTGLGERICRKYFETLLGSQFPKVRPSKLKWESGRTLELDGFSKKLGIAFEHQGGQHYDKINFYHKDKSAYKLRIEQDRFKREYCRQHGITLIEIPEVPRLLPISELRSYMFILLAENQIDIPNDFWNKKIDLRSVYTPKQNSFLSFYQKMAVKKGGKCLSKEYLNAREFGVWECKQGHRWRARFYSVKVGSWCGQCAGRSHNLESKKNAIKAMKKWAQKRNGFCLSESYSTAIDHYLWRCKSGHEWKSSWSQIKNQNSWCPSCAGNRPHTLQDLEKIVEARGGSIEKIYGRKFLTNSNVMFRCKVGHKWKVKAKYVIGTNSRLGTWCGKCSGTKKLSLNEVADQGKEFGFYLLSNRYTNSQSPLRWRCKKGHLRKCSLQALKRLGKNYCPECRGTARVRISKKSMKEKCVNAAKSKGGVFESKDYLGAGVRHKWKCRSGHTWLAVPNSVFRGTWCKICSSEEAGKRRRLGIDLFKSLAKKRGGVCLSEEYLSSDSKLKFKCKRGHIWNAYPLNVKNKRTWCPKCAKQFRAEQL